MENYFKNLQYQEIEGNNQIESIKRKSKGKNVLHCKNLSLELFDDLKIVFLLYISSCTI